LPELLRRVAVRTIVAAVAIGLLAPLSVRSATPLSAESLRLLAAADQPLTLADRAADQGRERSAALSLAAVVPPIGPESLTGAGTLPTPASAPMEATLYRRPASVNTVAPPATVNTVAPPATDNTVSGTATWYCCSLGWRGQAVVALPGALGGQYHSPPASRYVTVCADRCVVLPVVDYCDCYWGTSSQRVADLSSEAWAAVTDSPLSRGVLSVTVHLGG
jgi:hypothetical protein